MKTCEIEWINEAGDPTPDTNEAIGHVRVREHVTQIDGRGVKFPASRWYDICACHAKRLTDLGMHDWVFEALPVQPLDESGQSAGFEVG